MAHSLVKGVDAHLASQMASPERICGHVCVYLVYLAPDVGVEVLLVHEVLSFVRLAVIGHFEAFFEVFFVFSPE
jgi:hypothetical protein